MTVLLNGEIVLLQKRQFIPIASLKQYFAMVVLALREPDDKIVLTVLPKDGNTADCRKDNVQYVPKRGLTQLIINNK